MGERIVAAGGYIFHHSLPRMVPLLLRKEARSGGEAAMSYCFVPDGHDQRAFRSPFGNLRVPAYWLVLCQMLAGRGGGEYLPPFAPLQEDVSPLRRRGGGFPIAPATPSGRLSHHCAVPQRWQVAAALSAAVTTTN